LPYAEKHLCKVFYYKIMKKLSVEDSRKLVNSFVKSYGQRGAAQKFTEIGYMSPEGSQILQAHIFRILHGSGTCLLAPETENQQQETPITKEPIAAIPKMQKRIAAELFEDEELLQQEIAKTAEELRQELIEEEAALQEMQASLPPMVPLTADRPHRAHRHIEQDIRVSGILSFRAPIELDEEGATYFNIPKLKRKPPAIVSKPYQQRNFGQNVISSRDLSIRSK